MLKLLFKIKNKLVLLVFLGAVLTRQVAPFMCLLPHVPDITQRIGKQP